VTCTGRCGAYRAQNQAPRYAWFSGARYCKVCQIYVMWDGNFCPCCRRALARRPHQGKARKIMADRVRI